jgi:hypothetical protein
MPRIAVILLLLCTINCNAAVLSEDVFPEDVLGMTRVAMRILDRVAAAANSGMIKPAIQVGRSSSLALYDHDRRLIRLDSSLFSVAKQMGANGIDALAYVISHEYAHYVRGHSFSSRFQHSFGSFVSIKKSNTSDAKLLVSKQAESEADYYGVYFALLAGFDVQAKTIETFWSSVSPNADSISDSLLYINDEHQTHSERVRNAQLVIDEIEQLVKMHEAANVALLAGRYLEAAAVYEYICKDVVIPSVAWNELLARFLLLQRLVKRELVDPDLIRNEYVEDFRYRSSDVRVSLDVEQAMFRCRALLEVLSASHFNPDGIGQMNRLVELLQESYSCALCNDTLICDSHASHASSVVRALKSHHTRAGSAESLPRLTFDPTEMLRATMLIDEYSRVSDTRMIRLSYGIVEITSFMKEDRTYIRFAYRSPQSRSINRIDLVVERCEECQVSVVQSRDNIVKQARPGRIVTAALFTD